MDGNSYFDKKPPQLRLQLAQLLAALSHALDITEGQPPGHCVRCCWIGTQIGSQIGWDATSLRELYYAVLLKDLGCSSNAARICELYLTDDLAFKRDFKIVGDSVPEVVKFVLTHTGLQSALAERFRSILGIFQNGNQIARELIETRCQRGAQIARQMRFPEKVAQAIQCLDEHWDGGGKPGGLAATAIPRASQIALLAQVVDVFHTSSGPDAALAEVHRRSGSWFDPELVNAFAIVARDARFWTALRSDQMERAVLDLAPARDCLALDDDFMDDIAAAFGQIVDAKSPYTSGHSTRVAQYTDAIAAHLGIGADRCRWLRRGALLHDLGKLGVSNAILDKPGALDETEWALMRQHAGLTAEILSRIEAFSELAQVSAAHHERLDGKGYPNSWTASQISLETRIITTADIFDALTADRPYRAAMPIPTALEVLREQLGHAVDARCLRALEECLRTGAVVAPQ